MASSSYHTSLLTATNCHSHVHLIIGSNSLAGKRCEQSLATGARPILVTPDPDDASSSSSSSSSSPPLHYNLTKFIESGQVRWHRHAFTEDLLYTLGREEVNRFVDTVFVTTTTTNSNGNISAADISALCKRNRIPVNVVDRPDLCSFSILSTHTDGPLQIGITTNGRGCHLASRIRREVAATLPSDLGKACARLGEMRRRIQEEDHLVQEAANNGGGGGGGCGQDEEGLEQAASFNKLVTEEDLDAAKNRRVRWLAQVCEYWPLKRLAAISDEDVETVLKSYPGSGTSPTIISNSSSTSTSADGGHTGTDEKISGTIVSSRKGRVILAGSGPGHPDLLTRATYKAIRCADLILADKLVPAGVLDLIPRRTPVSIARKFPGNADKAQEELLEQAMAGVAAGKTVLRLKQGDPFIYGRGGEEVDYFRQNGLGDDRVTVLPGITSALSAPLFAGVPPTQRDVADQVLVCTGTGKKGKPPSPPEFVASRTCVFLMALHRITGLVAELTEFTPQELGLLSPPSSPSLSTGAAAAETTEKTAAAEEEKVAIVKPTRPLWPKTTPCAVIERASCPDQRVLRTTLEFVAEAIEQEGSRPPGLLVVGRACEALYTPEPGRPWTVEEGFKGLNIEDEAMVSAATAATDIAGLSSLT